MQLLLLIALIVISIDRRVVLSCSWLENHMAVVQPDNKDIAKEN